MSKVVKGVVRAVKKVVSGVASVVKKVVKSPIGKVIIAAAAVYFGGAALAGAMSSTAGSSALGAISNAWTSLGTAGSQLMAGNLGNVAGALGTGIQGGAATIAEGGNLIAGGLGGAAPGAMTTAAPIAPPINNPSAFVAPGATPPANNGLISGAWNALGDRSKAALISGATQIGGGMIQGMGQQKAAQEQRDYEAQQAQAARDRYNQNVGTMWWGPSSGAAPADAAAGGAAGGLVAGAMTPEQQRYEEYMRQRLARYSPYAPTIG